MNIRTILTSLAVSATSACALAAPAGPGPIDRAFPTTGSVRGLIIMAEFSDVKFLEKTTRDYIDTKVNSENFVSEEAAGSVADYFREQSKGLFTPVFDVVGPVTLPNTRASYGLFDNMLGLYRDAASAADKEADVDFTKYDVDEDGYVDFIFVIFPGHSRSQGGPMEAIHPSMDDLTNKVFVKYDGLYLSRAACSSELKGGEGENWDGIGTICHEFSHVLGLPDVYDSNYSGGYGMYHYDVMDYGSQNDDRRRPAGYTAMDRYTLGWLEPEILTETTYDVELKNLIDSNKAYFIVNPENENEYYTLENRQKVGFDAGLPGHGLVISLVNYDKKLWSDNKVNVPTVAGYEHVMLIAADDDKPAKATPDQEAGDPFPGTKGVTSFGGSTTPAAVWKSTGTTPTFLINNIRETEDGVIKFDFIADASGVNSVGDETVNVSGGYGCVNAPEGARVYSIDGAEVGREGLAAGIYVVCVNGRSVKVLVK